ncbi:MAG: hypothetical protein D3910_10990 [Candidatus Electrothrix sp. ATG2]|nr:hypothetical protein [Candidatus Electrothrix sp. ATG2]
MLKIGSGLKGGTSDYETEELVTLQVTLQATPEVTPEVGRMVNVLKGEMKRAEIMEFLDLNDENISTHR